MAMTEDATPALANDDAQPPGAAAGTGRFHVELHPASADARPFHALHGAVPAPAVAVLPSEIEAVIAHPPPAR